MNLLRFYGFRRLVAIMAFWPLVLVTRSVVTGGPPDGFANWSDGLRTSFGSLVRAGYTLALVIWIASLTRNFIWLRRRFIRDLAALLRLGLLCWLCIPVIESLATACSKIDDSFTPYLRSCCSSFARVYVLPVLFGLMPLFLLNAWEVCRAIASFQRWKELGTGHHASWINPLHLKRFTSRLPGNELWL
jgi:hypothetical protein